MDSIDYKNIPTTPGIYLFKAKNGSILYAGKAVNLRSRVKSYFSTNIENPRIRKMVETAHTVKFVEAPSEIEALILESQYIKKYKPKFNVLLRDDKQYFFVGITKEDFPKIFLTHQPLGKRVQKPLSRKNKSDVEFIGPFTDGASIKATLKLLRRIFPYCTCKQVHNNHCLNYHIGNCPGYCCLKNVEDPKKAEKEYSLNINAIKKILNGKKNTLVKKLTKDMMVAADKEDFEKSIQLREKIEKLERTFENARIISNLRSDPSHSAMESLKKAFKLKDLPERIEGYDISNIQGIFATASMVVFTDGKIDKSEYKKFKIRIDGKANDTAMIKEVLTRRFNHPEWNYPSLILIDGGKGQLNAALSILKEKQIEIPIISLTKDEKHKGSHVFSTTLEKPVSLSKLNELGKNLILAIDGEAHRFAITYYRKLHARSMRK